MIAEGWHWKTPAEWEFWASLDTPPELTAAMAGYQQLCDYFGPSPQSGMSARISLTMLNRHRVKAGLPALPPRPGAKPAGIVLELQDEIMRLRCLVREALCESDMDPERIARWLGDHEVPDLDDETDGGDDR